MTDANPSTDLVTVEKEGDGWRVKASGWGSFPIADRNTVTHAFDLARFCYDKGREDASALCAPSLESTMGKPTVETVVGKRRRLVLAKLGRSFPKCDADAYMLSENALLRDRKPKDMIRSQAGFDELMAMLNTVKP